MDKKYDFEKVEEDIYENWESSGYFNPDKLETDEDAESYVTMLPPPNITGSLHVGHALNATVQDIQVRKKRMEGFKTLWMPGIDHAGIAAQNVVEKQLAKKGKTRHELGREKFKEKVWEWKEESGDQILKQLKRLGASCDWSRTRFTLDKEYRKAVKKAFKEYEKKGYLYKGTRVVNWCPRCSTTLSDLELKYKEKESDFWHIKYPLTKGGDQDFITVATTRPETMLGDTAVAVHPSDDRYKELVGKKVKLPLTNRQIPIITDREVDPEFGTGAVKVTPSSDRADELIGRRNDLKTIKIIDKEGKMTDKVPDKYAGLDRFKARKKVVEDLKEKDLITKEEKIENRLALCDRCDTVIEPLPSKQWFVDMSKLKKPAIKAVKEGEINFYPKRFKKVYLDWMENVRDWCISRQIWWGHQLPIEGTDDVLDTWFSSALWPFATLGWPEKTKDMEEFYPNDLLVTAKDILYLWVARMIFSGFDLVGEKPFSDVYIHATVKTKDGKKMSKSLGTGIDPLDLIKEYGADATRFSLAWNSGHNQEIRYSEEDVVAGRNFNNKLWNAARFVLMNVEENYKLPTKVEEIKANSKENEKALKKLKDTISEVDESLDKYRYDLALQKVYHFFWDEFCDKCIEENKEAIFSDDEKKKRQAVEFLAGTLAVTLKLLHPFVPHISEKLWQQLHKDFDKESKDLIVSSWPQA